MCKAFLQYQLQAQFLMWVKIKFTDRIVGVHIFLVIEIPKTVVRFILPTVYHGLSMAISTVRQVMREKAYFPKAKVNYSHGPKFAASLGYRPVYKSCY